MSSWANGSTRAWREIRRHVLDRDKAAGWRCRAHDEGWCARAARKAAHRCSSRPTHAHHTRGRSVTGDDPRYIVASCAACNLHIGDPNDQGDPPCTPITNWRA